MSKYVLNQKEVSGEEALARQAFREGMKLYGYCGGLFGRDSFAVKTITEIDGNMITVTETRYAGGNGGQPIKLFGEVRSWVGLLEASNEALASGEYDDE